MLRIVVDIFRIGCGGSFSSAKMTNRRASLVHRGICALVLLWRCVLVYYTFYLIHWKALDLAAMIAGNPWVRGFLGFVIALVFSSVMYVLVERHLAALRRRLHN